MEAVQGNWIEGLRETILRAFNALPILITAFVGFMAVTLGNISLFMLFVGHAIIVPIATALLHLGTRFIPNTTAPSSDVTRLVSTQPSLDARINVAPSYWMAHLVFFFSYIFTNAIKVNIKPRNYKLSEWLYENRKSKTITVAVLSAFLLLALTITRYTLTDGAETKMGIFIAYVTMGLLGWGWFEFAVQCGARNGDLLSITQQIIPATAKDKKPMMCVYSAKP